MVLALPLLRANGGNCLKPDEVAERPVRYRQSWRDVRNAFGEDTRQIAVMHPELTLRFDHQNNSDYLTCPVARLQQDSQGSWQLDETFREDAKSQHLVVGCVSCPASPDSLLPAGESAALWLVGADAPVVMPRGEFYDASASDPLRNICERAVTQCELDEDPATCILFSHPQIPQVNECGWNTTHNLQDNYWGISPVGLSNCCRGSQFLSSVFHCVA